MSNTVLKVNQETINKMKEHYNSFLQAKNPPGGIFVAKTNGCTITAYKSGKVLFQGSTHDIEASKWGKADVKTAKTAPKKPKSAHEFAPPSNIGTMSIIGSDEVGTGDYFGPITVVAAFVHKDQLNDLKNLGVKDSKNLNDDQICSIAEKLLPVVPHSLLILHNKKYNELQVKGMTQGKMKAMLHNKAINNLLAKLDGKTSEVEGILIDQFALPDVYFNHIKKQEQHWNGNTYFSTKAEGVHLAVAAASIIARYSFVKEFAKLSEKAGITLQKGAGAKVDEVAARFIKLHGEGALDQFAKLHFANTEKAKRLVNFF